MADIDFPSILRSPTLDAIDRAIVAVEPRGHSSVVRCSSINRCERAQWYAFRWHGDPEQFEARQLRIFDTGNVEEGRMVGWLQMAGVEVMAVDPETGEQFTVSFANDHCKGHTDGEATGIIEAPKTPHLLECKTHNAKSFAQLVKHGVAISKPDHMAQMQIYMHGRKLNRAFYLAKNKDTDELYAERVNYDPAHAMALEAKAERIVTADRPPPRISEKPDWFECRFCARNDVCFNASTALQPRNCRNCLHSSPVMDPRYPGDWICNHHNRFLTLADQRAGCPSHLFIPDLVGGEQIDADEHVHTVTYRMPDGSTFTDGDHHAAAV